MIILAVKEVLALSPLLFYLVTDVLHEILQNAQENGYLIGVQISD
jgi:hypothetical protein